MLTDKQIKKLKPILHNFIIGNITEFNMAIRKLTKLEIVLLLIHTHEIMFLGKSKKIQLENKIIYALENKHY